MNVFINVEIIILNVCFYHSIIYKWFTEVSKIKKISIDEMQTNICSLFIEYLYIIEQLNDFLKINKTDWNWFFCVIN